MCFACVFYRFLMKNCSGFQRPLLVSMMLISVAAFAFTGSLSAKLIIIGSGDQLFAYWGHIGIVIKNADSGEDLVYDFGNFSFLSENFYRDFLQGQMKYLSAVTPTDTFFNHYLEENMDVSLYALNLGDEELEELDSILKWWILPENRSYTYNYFINNCSTIIRDILDQVTDGQLKAQTHLIPDKTFRQHARIGSYQSLPAEIMLHYLLGPFTDKPISGWDLMFLPNELAKTASNLEYTGRDGKQRILVGEEQIVKLATRPTMPETPRVIWPLFLALSVLMAIIWVIAASSIRWRGIWRVVQSLIVLFIGIPGAVIGFFSVFTDHFVGYDNINILPAFPTLLLCLIPVWKSKMKHQEVVIACLWTINLAGLLLAIFLKISGLSIQDAYAFWVLYGVITLTASYPGLLLRRRLFNKLGLPHSINHPSP